MNTALITDTDASLPLPLAERHGITQVPIMVHFGEESFRAVYELDDNALFERIRQSGLHPRTSAPSPGQFADAYRQALENGAERILCITVSATVSGTYAAACNARDLFPQADITVLDSQSLSIGQGFMVLAAAEALEAGADVAEAVAAAESVRSRTHLFAALDTLEYLARSGRVGHLTARFANALAVKPILTIRNGKLEMLERIRTEKRAWERLRILAAEHSAGRPLTQAALLDVGNESEQAQAFLDFLRQDLPYPETPLRVELTPGLSVHTGPRVLGLAFVTD